MSAESPKPIIGMSPDQAVQMRPVTGVVPVREVKVDIHQFDSVSMYLQGNNLTFYVENVNFYGTALYLQNSSATGGTRCYLKNCTMRAIQVNGVTESILQGCTIYGAIGDGINYTRLNDIQCSAIEIDCDIYHHGADATNQASTAHYVSNIVRINGKYHHVTGQCVAEADTCKTWMLGAEMYNSGTGVGYYTAGTAWLDHCWSHDNATCDLHNGAASTIYIRNFIGAKGVNVIEGTLTAY